MPPREVDQITPLPATMANLLPDLNYFRDAVAICARARYIQFIVERLPPPIGGFNVQLPGHTDFNYPG